MVLNQEIDRLQREKIDLTQELGVCRLEISRESSCEREVEQGHSLLVLLFVEIESLRNRLLLKEEEYH